MRTIRPYLANGWPKICWSCGKPFAVREGHAQALVGPGGNLYCHRESCEEAALLPHVFAIQNATAPQCAA